jgi:hypothetical protein
VPLETLLVGVSEDVGVKVGVPDVEDKVRPTQSANSISAKKFFFFLFFVLLMSQGTAY